MISNPKISIIMPAYNSEKYIAESIKSVLAQKYENYEFIIVDDASKDRTIDIINSFHDDRIKLIKNDSNHGVAFSRNLGAQEAIGEYLAFVDSDDLWREDKLQLQIEFAEKNIDVKLFFTGSSFINAHGDKLDYMLNVPAKITREEILKQNLISCSSVLIDRNVFLSHPMPLDKGIHEDFACWLAVLKDEKYAYGLNLPLLIYRVQANSKSGNKIKAARMQWKTYKVAGEPWINSICNLITYSVRGLSKYRMINKAETGQKE